MDLRSVNLTEESAVALRGQWEYYGASLLDPSVFGTSVVPQPEHISFPSVWNDLNRSRTPGNGYATYRLLVLISGNDPIALELPHFYSNYALWINGKKIAGNGTVGTSKETSVPAWLPQTVVFEPDDDTLEFVIQASNFHHALGGIREDILLGNPAALAMKRTVAMTSFLVAAIILFLIALVAFFIYVFGRRDSAFLYLSLLAFTWAVRSLFSNLYIANHYIPSISWEVGVTIEYLSLYLTMAWAILFVSSVFMSEVKRVFTILFCSINALFTVITLLSEASFYTQFLPVYLSTAGLLLLYVLYILVRAVISDLEGVWLMISCLFLAVMVFAYDIISYEGFAFYNPIVVNTGYVIIFILLAATLIYQPTIANRKKGQPNVLRYEDLYSAERK